MPTNSLVLAGLTWAKGAVANVLAGTAAETPKLVDETLTSFEAVVAPALDMPPVILALARGQNAAIEGAVDPFLESKLHLLGLRIDALFPTS